MSHHIWDGQASNSQTVLQRKMSLEAVSTSPLEETTHSPPELDPLVLAKEAVISGLLKQDVLDHLTSFHPQVPNSMKQRYLLTQLYSAVSDTTFSEYHPSVCQVQITNDYSYKSSQHSK